MNGAMSAFGTKRTQLHRTCPLSGVKRTWPFALHMSAFGPKRLNGGGTMRCGEPQSPYPRRRRQGATTCVIGIWLDTG